jgi:magnesium-transporting ATPase (P-type)
VTFSSLADPPWRLDTSGARWRWTAPKRVSARPRRRERLKPAAQRDRVRKTPAWLRFLRQFNDPMVIILLAHRLRDRCSHGPRQPHAAGHDRDLLRGAAESVLGFVQEGKAEGALDALRNMMVQECLVQRDGERKRVAARPWCPAIS